MSANYITVQLRRPRDDDPEWSIRDGNGAEDGAVQLVDRDGEPLPGKGNRRYAGTQRDGAGGCGATVAGKIEEPASTVLQSTAAVSGAAVLMSVTKKAPRRSAGPSLPS